MLESTEFYRIDGTLDLSRPIGREEASGFTIYLDPLFAMELTRRKRTDEFTGKLEEEAGRINKSHAFPQMHGVYRFFKDSVLMNAAFPNPHFDLFIDGSELDSFLRLCNSENGDILLRTYRNSSGLEYIPHNIDSRRQEVCVYELWEPWYKAARGLFTSKELAALREGIGNV